MTSKAAKTRYAQRVIAAQERIVRKHYAAMRGELRRVGADIAAVYARGEAFRIDEILRAHGDRVAVILLSANRLTGKVFMDMHAQPIKAEAETFIGEQIYSMLAANAITTATSVAATTSAVVSGVILQQMRESTPSSPKTPSDIADALKKRLGGSSSGSRAMTILRTETHKAANTAQFERVKQASYDSGLVVEVEWMATNQRVRDAHEKANGQRRPIGESFDVGGEKLRYPGDPNGSAKNTINCRCVLGYHTKKLE